MSSIRQKTVTKRTIDPIRSTEVSQNDNTIFETVKQCVNEIAAYTTSDRPLSRRYATDMQQKLEVWAKYSGATSRQGLSLDDRLVALPGVSHAILGLLSLIATQIKQASSLPDQEIEVLDDGLRKRDHGNRQTLTSKGSSNDFEARKIRNQDSNSLCKSWAAIAKAIDSLYKLAGAIRDNDHSGGDVEVPGHYSRPDDPYFEDMAKLLVRRWFPHARRELCDQLGYGIFVRRRKILYRQRHEEKLQFQRSPGLLGQVGIESTVLPGRLANLLRESSSNKTDHLGVHNVGHHIVAPSLTQFSQFQTQSTIMRRKQAATVITSKTRGILVHDSAELQYPETPKASAHETPIFCPYCCKQLTQSQLHNWRRHVDEDLKPFICLSETCQYPLKFFSLQSDWLQHMGEYHGIDWPQNIHMTTWFCDIGHKEQLEFVTVESFRQHLATHMLSNTEQDVLIRHNQASGTRELRVCPLCEDVPQQKTKLGIRALFDHIAVHLKRIALMALPITSIGYDSEDNVPDDLQSDEAIMSDSPGDVNDLSRSAWTPSSVDSAGYDTVIPRLEHDTETFFDGTAQEFRRPQVEHGVAPILTPRIINSVTLPGLEFFDSIPEEAHASYWHTTEDIAKSYRG